MDMNNVYLKILNNNSIGYILKCYYCGKILNFYLNLATKEKFIQQKFSDSKLYSSKTNYFLEICVECDDKINASYKDNIRKELKNDIRKEIKNEWKNNLNLEKKGFEFSFLSKKREFSFENSDTMFLKEDKDNTSKEDMINKIPDNGPKPNKFINNIEWVGIKNSFENNENQTIEKEKNLSQTSNIQNLTKFNY